MIRLDAAGGIVGVDVEGVQVCADLLDGGEVLGHAGACLEDVAFGGFRAPGHVGVRIAGDVGVGNGFGHFDGECIGLNGRLSVLGLKSLYRHDPV